MTVMIPTKGRPEKLLRCVMSIDFEVDIVILATCKDDVPEKVFNHAKVYINKDLTVPQAFNFLASQVDGDLIMGSDDVEYESGYFKAVEKMFNELGRDCVLGTVVSNMVCNEDAFQAIGSEFRKRFKDKLYCEEYKHFYIDTEMGDFARKLNKFFICPDARLKNYHPVSGEPADKTHSEGRNEKLSHDRELYERRKLLCG